MYLDNAAALRRLLPGLIAPMASVTAAAPEDPFIGNLMVAMQLAEPYCCAVAEPWAERLAPAWSELIVMADGPRSQYDALRETLSGAGSPPGHLACVALQGQGFHGQHGRQWQALAGNLHLTALLVGDLPAARYAAVLPALPAVAVAEAVEHLCGGKAQAAVKWVNDVMVGERKIAGSLTALRSVEGRVKAVVVGVGLNVRAAPVTASDGGGWEATSLAAVPGGERSDLPEALLAVLNALAARWTDLSRRGPESLLAAYRDRSLLIGREVEVWPDTEAAPLPLVRGQVEAIGPDLSLRLAGREQAVTEGRVRLAAPGT